jgi:hypothetical protein
MKQRKKICIILQSRFVRWDLLHLLDRFRLRETVSPLPCSHLHNTDTTFLCSVCTSSDRWVQRCLSLLSLHTLRLSFKQQAQEKQMRHAEWAHTLSPLAYNSNAAFHVLPVERKDLSGCRRYPTCTHRYLTENKAGHRPVQTLGSI